MNKLEIMCCFCEKIRDDRAADRSQTTWHPFKAHMEKYGLRPETVRISHTYCPDCLAYYKEFLSSRKEARERVQFERPELKEQA